MNVHPVQIKICGLTRPEDCLAVNSAGADYAGFVFAPSRRRIGTDQARRFIQLLAPSVTAVGVFVEETNDQITAIVRLAALQVIQLHGPIRPGRIKALRQQLPVNLPIWQRLPVLLDRPETESLAAAECSVRQLSMDPSDMNDLPDAWLLDSCMPGQAGGTGQPFAWPIFSQFCQQHPAILAGGLHAGNIQTALDEIQPIAVDCSSGVETDGQKDPIKISLFCRMVREHQPGRIG